VTIVRRFACAVTATFVVGFIGGITVTVLPPLTEMASASTCATSSAQNSFAMNGTTQEARVWGQLKVCYTVTSSGTRIDSCSRAGSSALLHTNVKNVTQLYENYLCPTGYNKAPSVEVFRKFQLDVTLRPDPCSYPHEFIQFQSGTRTFWYFPHNAGFATSTC
jgi:hypothetical protein